MPHYLGEILALATSLFWALTSTFFTLAGQRVGSQVVNRARLAIAAVCLALIHLVAFGALVPHDATSERVGWLAASAVIGLVLGDGLLFYAFTQIGARLSMLLMALAPVIGTLLAWLFLGETLPLVEVSAILVTIAGIAWVVQERHAPTAKIVPRTPRAYLIGVLCGVGAATGQAAGLVLSKRGMVGGFPALSASLIRLSVAAVVIWIIAALQRQARPTLHALRDRLGLRYIIAGAIVGPVIGMTMSLAAVSLSHVGIASTLMALSPVLMLPLGYWLFQERITLRAVLGTGIAMMGVAMLLAGCGARPPASTAQPGPFEGARAYEWVERQCALGYRITGTEASIQAGDMFIAELEALGWETREQVFTYMDTPVRNLLVWRGEGPAVMVGAHYDTRRSADEEDPSVPVMGANDGASGVAVLLELARVLDMERVPYRVYLAFFDAEDNGRLDGWEWIVGSTYMAAHWGEAGEPPLETVIVVDMVGDINQTIYYEHNSDPALSAELWTIAADLGYGDRFIPEYKYAVLDDHIPFVRMGIPSALIIDFDYPYWHTTQDTPDKISAESLEAVGRVVQVWLERDDF